MTSPEPTFTVLGAEGFIGAALCRHLAREGMACRAVGRGDVSYFSEPLGHAIYCIGLTADYAARPLDTVDAHVGLFAALLRGAHFESLTYLSSTRLYDDGGGGRERDDLSLNPHNPRHLYDFSKGLGESLCVASGRENVRSARLSCVYSSDLGADGFLHGVLRDIRETGIAEVDTHPDTARDYIFIDDVCRALVAIAHAGRRPIYNVASGRNVSNRDLFALIERTTGGKVRNRHTGSGASPGAPRIDTTAMAEDLGLVPQSLETVLPRLWEHQAPGLPEERSVAT